MNEHQEALTAELHKMLREPMLSRTLHWAKEYEKLNNDPWIQQANCESFSPKECLINHYLKTYHEKRKSEDLSLLDPLFAGISIVLLLSYSAVLASVWMSSMALAPIIILGLLVVYGVNNFVLTGLYEYKREALQEAIYEEKKDEVLALAQGDYLSLIFTLLTEAAISEGIEYRRSFIKTAPLKAGQGGMNRSIKLDTLFSYSGINFSGDGRQVVMLDDKLNNTGFFNVFVRSPKLDDMQLILEAGGARYTLSSLFDLRPLRTLFRHIGIENVRLLYMH